MMASLSQKVDPDSVANAAAKQAAKQISKRHWRWENRTALQKFRTKNVT
jgi:hypothetical protein